MTLRGQFEVTEFSASNAPKYLHPIPWNYGTRNWSRFLGLVGTLSLHGLAIQSLDLGSIRHTPRPPDLVGAGAMRLDAQAPPAEELILVTINDVQQDDARRDAMLASLGPIIKDLPIVLLSADPDPAKPSVSVDNSSDPSAPVTPEAGDPAVRALMFGRYTGQIDARIERAWRRPRTPLVEDDPLAARRDVAGGSEADGDTFRCRVQIRQDGGGLVQDVQLLECNGTEEWRRSLVIAINQASPLPAPPVPNVFTQSLTMTFEAQPWRPGRSPDGYENAPRTAATLVNSRPPQGVEPQRHSALPFADDAAPPLSNRSAAASVAPSESVQN